MNEEKLQSIIKFVEVLHETQARRVLEIALLGKFSVCFTGSKDGTGMIWGRIANELDLVSFFLVPCPCGYLADSRHSCQCTTSQLHDYYQTSFARTALAADLHCEIPNLKLTSAAGESFSESIKRVRSAIFKKLDFSTEGKKFLGFAIRNLEPSEIRIEKTKQIACVIACLGSSQEIEAHHVAEAIHYRPKDFFDFFV